MGGKSAKPTIRIGDARVPRCHTYTDDVERGRLEHVAFACDLKDGLRKGGTP